ncbi:putative phosphorylase b kinase gamma catalytic chain, skeletal muscle/heart isoform isoform X2 [Apostichopus japonicus]|uniref:phosphorylase kinase n=3 Tax=Stichopus japonicus TaxID=307972 RepID=A0A2G8L0F2_STIJA|nr:putative phosphorylase b kinase gamma catalytic chain, skeletal muscle/heart isoform isoform X2 [Apostichopus japonicus]
MKDGHELILGEDDVDWSERYGRDFSNRYIPGQILGKGLSSTVRRCIDRENSSECAVKIIDIFSAGSDSNEEAEALTEEYFNEVSILRKLCDEPGHANIITLFDFIETPTYLFLVLELCHGGELFDYLTKVVTLSEKKTRTIMKRVFEAVQYIHSHNIVHRDLKPENILLDEQLRVKISDFGMAMQLEEGTLLTELCGTPGYMAPEMLKTSMNIDGVEGYAKEIDNWACGVIMYTLLVGFAPFWHRKKIMMMRAIMEGRYHFSGPEWSDISDVAKDLIAKLLVVNPMQRLTAEQALQHEFFQQMEAMTPSPFQPRRRFKAIIIIVYAVCSLQKYSLQKTVPIRRVCTDPYGSKELRKALDTSAFAIYGHWVKKGERQNRAALFENKVKAELRSRSKSSSISSTPNITPSSSFNHLHI